MHVVTGPRLDPDAFPAPPGVHVHGFLPDLDLHHAACDVAVVQGGLSTTMELTAAGRPFLYFPLRHHFEQQVHVRHRLERHRAGRAMDYDAADPDPSPRHWSMSCPAHATTCRCRKTVPQGRRLSSPSSSERRAAGQ